MSPFDRAHITPGGVDSSSRNPNVERSESLGLGKLLVIFRAPTSYIVGNCFHFADDNSESWDGEGELVCLLSFSAPQLYDS